VYRALESEFTHRKLEVRWAPGHQGVEGNEMADEAAKGGTSEEAAREAGLELEGIAEAGEQGVEVGPAMSRKEKTSKTREEGERQDDEPRDLGGQRRQAILPHHSTYSTRSRALSLTALRAAHQNTSLTL